MGGWLNVRGLRRGLGGTLRGDTLGGGGYVGGGGGYVGGVVCWMLDRLRGYVGGREYVGGGRGGGGVCWGWGRGGGVVDVKSWSKMLFLGTFWKITTNWSPLDERVRSSFAEKREEKR